MMPPVVPPSGSESSLAEAVERLTTGWHVSHRVNPAL